jgi:hypothetical protein
MNAPEVPAAIGVPDGSTLKMRLRGLGMQIYACLAIGGGDGKGDGGPAAYGWVFEVPNAILLDMKVRSRQRRAGGTTRSPS